MAKVLEKANVQVGQYVSFMQVDGGDLKRVYGKVVDTHYDEADGEITVTINLGESSVHPTVDQLIARKASVHDDLELLKILNDRKASFQRNEEK